MSQGPNAKFRDMLLNPGAAGLAAKAASRGTLTSQNEVWNFEVLYSFLVHTYCFDDAKLRCPRTSPYVQPPPGSSWLHVGGLLLAFGALCLVAGLRPVSAVLKYLRRTTKSPKQRN